MEPGKKKISICGGTDNEEGNIREFYTRVKAVLDKFPQYDYEFIISDNCSVDRTREILREIAAADPNFKCILNSSNFGAARSGYSGFLQSTGDASVLICSDLQDPPEMVEEFLQKWAEGYQVVCAVKQQYSGSFVMKMVRRVYYRILDVISETPQLQNFHGFGLYDRKVMDALRKFNEPIPYMRGLVAEVGFKRCSIPYAQPERRSGRSSYNFFTYYDYAMVGFVNYSKAPLRLAVFSGFVMAFISILIAFGYLVYKLLNWDTFQLGLAPLVIGLFFFSAVQLIFVGIIGEYIGAIWTQVKNKPLVIEDEKINFD